MNKQYVYAISNVSDTGALVAELKRSDGVIECYVEEGKLYYVLDERMDEYPVLIEANELCAKYGGALVIGEDDEGEFVGEGGESEDMQGGDGEDDEEEYDSEERADKPAAKKSIFAEEEEDYSEMDEAVFRKKKNKQETFLRFGELILSAVLLTICYLVGGTDGEFGFVTMIAVLAFAVGGYEIFYSAIMDIVHKKPLTENVLVTVAAVIGALLGYVLPTTAFILAFSLAREIAMLGDNVTAQKMLETFYTGSVSVRLESGAVRRLETLEAGDRIRLNEMDVVPCDGVAESDVTVDAYITEGVPSKKIKAGDKVEAGNVVLKGSLLYQATAPAKESRLALEKKAFGEKLGSAGKVAKPVAIINAVCLGVIVLGVFLLPLFGDVKYLEGLRDWGARGMALIAASMLVYGFTLANKCVVNTLVSLRAKRILVDGEEALKKLGTANSFKFQASTLTENGKVKEDAYGCANELLASGVKNVGTEFNIELNDEARAKLDFVEKPVEKERPVTVGEFVTLSGGGEVDILDGELSYIPLCYKAAKAAIRRKRAILVGRMILSVALVAVTFAFAPAAFNPIYFGAISGLICSLFALGTLLSAKSND